MSIIECAKAAKLTEASLSNIERGKQTPSLPTLRKLSGVLHAPVSYLGQFESLPEETLGQKITKARKYHGLTKREMASEIGVDVKTLRGWEKDAQKPLKKFMAGINKLLQILEDNHNHPSKGWFAQRLKA